MTIYSICALWDVSLMTVCIHAAYVWSNMFISTECSIELLTLIPLYLQVEFFKLHIQPFTHYTYKSLSPFYGLFCNNDCLAAAYADLLILCARSEFYSLYLINVLSLLYLYRWHWYCMNRMVYYTLAVWLAVNLF